MPFQRIPRVSDLLPGAIKGLWTIGDTSSWHVEIGTHPNDGSPSAGESGIRLYGADGVSVLIDLRIGGTPTITSAIVQTAATGQRVVLSGPDDALEMFTGGASETAPGQVAAATFTDRSVTRLSAHVRSPAGVAGTWGQLNVSPTGATLTDNAGNPLPLDASAVNDANGNPLPYWAGTTQRTFDAGRTTVTTDASGQFTVAHNLGVVPLAATGTLRGTPRRWVTVIGTGTNASQIQFQVNDSAGVVASTAGINVDWITVG